MFVIKEKQLNKLDVICMKDFFLKVTMMIDANYESDYIQKKTKNKAIDSFVLESYFKSKKYYLNQEDSIAAYILLSFINGEGFLEKEEFKSHKNKLTDKEYDPNKYIFQIPI